MDCFARGTDLATYHRWWDGTAWGGWGKSRRGPSRSSPSCTSWGPNRIDCFARGTDLAMYHCWWDGTVWGGWESLGGTILDRPDCVSWGPNRIDCFARGTDLAMYHRWWDGTAWGGWESLGGGILEQPECVSWGEDRIDCFARGAGYRDVPPLVGRYRVGWMGRVSAGSFWNNPSASAGAEPHRLLRAGYRSSDVPSLVVLP